MIMLSCRLHYTMAVKYIGIKIFSVTMLCCRLQHTMAVNNVDVETDASLV